MLRAQEVNFEKFGLAMGSLAAWVQLKKGPNKEKFRLKHKSDQDESVFLNHRCLVSHGTRGMNISEATSTNVRGL